MGLGHRKPRLHLSASRDHLPPAPQAARLLACMYPYPNISAALAFRSLEACCWGQVPELSKLRQAPALAQSSALELQGNASHNLGSGWPAGAGNASETVVSFRMPTVATRCSVRVLGDGKGDAGAMDVWVEFEPASNSSQASWTVGVGSERPSRVCERVPSPSR